MYHILTVTILVVVLAVLVRAVALSSMRRTRPGHSGSSVSHLGILVTLPLLVLVAVLLFYSRSTTAQVTAYTALLAALAGAFAWSIKATKESLQNRAELLISEALSCRSMDRNDIRGMIYENNALFRLSKASYIDALNHLLATRRVVLIGGQYSINNRDPGQ